MLLVVALVAVGASFGGGAVARVNAGRAASAQERAIAGTAFQGTIRPGQQFTIAAPATTLVQRVLARLGDEVRPGQPLLVLDDREALAGLRAAELELRSAESRVADLRRQLALLDRVPATAFAQATSRLSTVARQAEQVPTRQWRDSPERAEAAHESARLRYERVRKLNDQGLVARQELEEAELALRVAANDLENAGRAASVGQSLQAAQQEQADLQWQLARAEQQQQRDQRRADLTSAEVSRDEASLRVDAARQRLAATTVTATSAAVIVEQLAHPGDQIYAGSPLLRLAVLDTLIIEVQVAPSVVNAFRPGQRADITLPSLPPRQTAGEIVAVSPMPNAAGNHVVEVRFANRDRQLLAGQPAEVRFQVP